MAKKLTKAKAREILHDKEVHGQPLTDKQRRFFGAIAGGAEPYKAENGIEGTMGGLTDKGFNFNPAWGGAWRDGGKLTENNWLDKYQDGGKSNQASETEMILPEVVVSNKEKVLRHTPSASGNYQLTKTVTPFKTNRQIRKGVEAPLYPNEVNFISNYAGAIGSVGSVDSLPSAVPFEGEKHWNIDRFIMDPAFSEEYPNLRSGQSKKGLKKNVLADMYKYYMLQGQDKDDAFRSAKQFMRQEINPRLNSKYFKEASRLTGVHNQPITEFANQNPFIDLRNINEDESLRSNPFYKEYFENPITEREMKQISKSYLKNFKKMSGKESRKKVKEWIKEANAPEVRFQPSGISMGQEDYRDGGNLMPPMAGADQTVPMYAMGGSLPGSVGFMYARTAGAAPSEGPYAKKTLPSAQNGAEMAFYQQGLDWKPKTISRNGGWLDKFDDEVPQAQGGDVLEYLKKTKSAPVVTKGKPLTAEQQKRITAETLNRQTKKNKPLTQSSAKDIFYANQLNKYGRTKEDIERSRKEAEVPFLLATGMLAAPAIAPTIASAAPLVGPALATEVAGIPGATVGNLLGSASIATGAMNVPTVIEDWRNVDDISSFAGALGNTGLTALELAPGFSGARALGKESYQTAKNLGTAAKTKYVDIAEGNNPFSYAWRSPAVGLSQESSSAMFAKLANSEVLTPTERALIAEYQFNSRPFTGRSGFPINVDKRNQLNSIIEKYGLNVEGDAIATRLFNPRNNSLGATLENKVLDFGDRPTSFSAGIGVQGFGSGAVNRIVIPNRHLKTMGNRFVKNDYTSIPEEIIQQYPEGMQGTMRSLSKANAQFNEERELIGTGLKFKRLGKVKNDIGGYDWVVKPFKKGGEIVKDDMGYWNPENWGKPVEINSNKITMEGVLEPLLGVSNTGDTKMMYPGKNYTFSGTKVVEYPREHFRAENGKSVNRADEYPLEKLDNLLNFTNYNKPKAKSGKWLDKYK